MVLNSSVRIQKSLLLRVGFDQFELIHFFERLKNQLFWLTEDWNTEQMIKTNITQ